MDWAGWALFGLVATTALTAVMISAQLAGLTRLDMPLLLGTIVTEDPDRARVAGFVIHLAIGQGFALGYPSPTAAPSCSATSRSRDESVMLENGASPRSREPIRLRPLATDPSRSRTATTRTLLRRESWESAG